MCEAVESTVFTPEKLWPLQPTLNVGLSRPLATPRGTAKTPHFGENLLRYEKNC